MGSATGQAGLRCQCFRKLCPRLSAPFGGERVTPSSHQTNLVRHGNRRRTTSQTIRKLQKFAAKLPRNPSPEKIHKLRTNARKLESTFAALSLDSGNNERRLIKEVRRIRKRAGKVRDLDVLTGDLATIPVEGESDCQVQLLEHLGGKRRKQARKLRKLISSHRADMKQR